MTAASESRTLTKNLIIAQLSKSSHGDLDSYIQVGFSASLSEPEFFAHLIAWNFIKGEVRDSKIALPVISLLTDQYPETLVENSLAHLAMLDPRSLVKALEFHRKARKKNSKTRFSKVRRDVIVPYLRAREENWAWWERTALSHRASMRTLYGFYSVKPNAMADEILFKNRPPKGTVFHAMKELPRMGASEVAGVILRHEIPARILEGVIGARMKEPEILMAMITQMSPTEVVTKTKQLQKLGLKTNPAAMAAYREKIAEVAKSKRNTLKTTRAAEVLVKKDADTALIEQLRGAQEKQLDQMKVEGNWLILADKSASMDVAIEVSRQVAGTLARVVKGKVMLVFFDEVPRALDVSGKGYDEIKAMTAMVVPSGNTSIGCGLVWAIDKGFEFDGITIISDGAENRAPIFAQQLMHYAKRMERDFPVYLYLTRGQVPNIQETMRLAQLDIQVFDLRFNVDHYSIPNMVQTMRVKRYSLTDEIMETSLVALKDALKASAMARI